MAFFLESANQARSVLKRPSLEKAYKKRGLAENHCFLLVL